MSAGRERVAATFWLIEAPDSLAQQSRRNPDGTGLGTYDEHDRPVIAKQALAAYEDQQFARESREVRSPTFVAHVRHASTGAISLENTHPFEQAGREFAHNGVIEDVDGLDAELGDARALVKGETDSERYFALITKEIEQTGDIAQGIERATGWISEHLPLFSINFVLTTPSDLWALRYPGTNELHVLERAAGGGSGNRHLEHASRRGTVRVRSGDLASRPAVIVASEPMDEDCGWRALQSGELVHVDPDLNVTIRTVLARPPAHPLTIADLDKQAAESQTPPSPQ